MTAPPRPARGPGRRPGAPDTRGEILAAARMEFAAKGFEATTVRGVARTAGVDSALVHHYFGTKAGLFIEALEIPFDPRTVVTVLQAAPPDELGLRLVRTFLDLWDSAPAQERLQAILRSLVSNEAAIRLLREGMTEILLGPVIKQIGVPDAGLRANLVASHLVGLAMARYIIKMEPVASTPNEQIVAWVGPTVQRYLHGDL